ncbi:dihydrofolate reductase family protein [Jatrophihabitans sp.]|uniref:dihydrofolate reductase family protein n=1 Tax=Jatrophihabitans sp. TaxID=1932789 RepID=UPI002B65C8C9|nr:dihydrofolate reductase family protein [Jatrophihabitans sp.]
MARMLYSATMSLDGFIAGPGGDMSWLTDYLGPNPVADELVPRIGALLIGHRTFTGDDPNRGTDAEGAFGGTWSGPQVVLTHATDRPAVPDVTFLDDFDAAVAAAKAAAGERYVNILGADVARQCLQAGVLDEILVFVAPVLLGDGVRLLDWPGGTTARLERLSVSEVPLAVGLWFRVLS